MRTKLSLLKSAGVLCCLLAGSLFTTVSAQTKTVWVIGGGTYDADTQAQVLDEAVVVDGSTFSSNDYNAAVGEFVGVESRIFKFGGSLFTAPEGYSITSFEIYGWPRHAGVTSITSIDIDGVTVVTFDEETPSPYEFADCGESVNSTNRTPDNISIVKINEISETTPAKSFKSEIKGETHAFCKLVLAPTGTTGIESVPMDQQSKWEDNVYYDLMGRKIENPTNGVYIYNGKKVLIKK